jgi:hypothetical protein
MSTALRAHRLQVSMTCSRSDELASFAKIAIRISFGSRWIGGRHSSSLTCMSWIFGTPSEVWESLPARKKSDSSLSGGAGELDDDVERESSCGGWTCGRGSTGRSTSGRASNCSSVITPAMISIDAPCLSMVAVSVPQRSAGCCECCRKGGLVRGGRRRWDVEWVLVRQGVIKRQGCDESGLLWPRIALRSGWPGRHSV